MESIFIGLIEAIGANAFFLSILWGIYNYQHEVKVTELWTVYTGAAITGFLFTGLKSMQWFGIAPTLTDQLQPLIGIIFATILLVTAVICAVSPVKKQVK